MDIDQIVFPPEPDNKRSSLLDKDLPMPVWFVLTSYQYIHPTGFSEHVKFIRDLPGAYMRFRQTMKQ
jgi:hypothetical protein